MKHPHFTRKIQYIHKTKLNISAAHGLIKATAILIMLQIKPMILRTNKFIFRDAAYQRSLNAILVRTT